jgi:hypothetical protein
MIGKISEVQGDSKLLSGFLLPVVFKRKTKKQNETAYGI